MGVEQDWSFEEAFLGLNADVQLLCVDGTTGPEEIRARLRARMWKAVRQIRPGLFLRTWRLRHKPEQFAEFFSRHAFMKRMVAAQTSPGCISVPDLVSKMDEALAGAPLFLKMDIEGAEYECLQAAGPVLPRFTGMAVEFHELHTRWDEFEATMRLLSSHFHVAHLHGNNYDRYVLGTRVPQTLEVTLIRRTLVAGSPSPSRARYPGQGLDAPNNPRHADMVLDFDTA